MKQLMMVFTLLLASQASQAGLRVLACEPEWAALVVELASDLATVTSATTAHQDPHTVQARPSLIASARNSDLLVCAGADLEAGWLPLLLQKSANPRIQPGQTGHFIASRYVKLLGKPASTDRRHGDIHADGNPHIHTSPLYMLKVADALLPVLQQLLPQHAEQLKLNHADFRQKLLAALQQWQTQISALHGKKVVVHHDNWLYLNAWLGITSVATLEPKPGLPPSSGHLASLMTQLKATPAELIIHTTYQDDKAAQWLSGKTAIPVLALPATVENWQQTGALLDWYQQLLLALAGNKQ